MSSPRFEATALVVPFEHLRMTDVESVGGKNASLGEMISQLAASGVRVPGGFATTAHAFRQFLKHNGLAERINAKLAALNTDDVRALAEAGAQIRQWVEETPFPPESFDTVVVINVLDHVRDVAQCLRNAQSILRPGGWFVLGQDLAKPDTIGQVEYRWYEQGHPHRVVMQDLEPYVESLDARYKRIVEPRDPKLQASVLAFAGVKPP